MKRIRKVLSILTALSYTTCAGFHLWAGDEALRSNWEPAPDSLPALLTYLAIAFQPWILLPFSMWSGNSDWSIIVVEAGSAVVLGVLLLLAQRGPKNLHRVLITLLLVSSVLLAWSALHMHLKTLEFNSRIPT